MGSGFYGFWDVTFRRLLWVIIALAALTFFLLVAFILVPKELKALIIGGLPGQGLRPPSWPRPNDEGLPEPLPQPTLGPLPIPSQAPRPEETRLTTQAPPATTRIPTTITATSTTTTKPRPVCPVRAARFGPLSESMSHRGGRRLVTPGCYDLRVVKGGRLVGCAAPINLFPGNKKYGCAGEYGTAESCDTAWHPIRDTAYVWSVHAGCMTGEGKGTYGYAYDDGVGLKQCSSITKYEWFLCPTGEEGPISWAAERGLGQDTIKRFRVTNKCAQPVWIQQAGAPGTNLEYEPQVMMLQPGTSHTYSIPNRGLAATRFLPKTGCDASGNACDVQSIPPCPPQGCDLPVDTKFEASWGCVYARGTSADRTNCALTPQGHPCTYQDWWDGSAVDGWTLPFSVLTDDGGHGLTADSTGGSPSICGDVVCAGLDAGTFCPTDDFLTPELTPFTT